MSLPSRPHADVRRSVVIRADAGDDQTWTIPGFDICCVDGCHCQPVIIANIDNRDRFCEWHVDIAARVALEHPAFPGWYRITDTSTELGRLNVTVHSL